jgi:hypothetical protein
VQRQRLQRRRGQVRGRERWRSALHKKRILVGWEREPVDVEVRLRQGEQVSDDVVMAAQTGVHQGCPTGSVGLVQFSARVGEALHDKKTA